MSLRGIQEIRNLLNVFANNVFVATNYSRCVVLKLHAICNSQIITRLEAVWWIHIAYIKCVLLGSTLWRLQDIEETEGWLECLIVTVNQRTYYIQFHVGGI